jgi:hypothetical protein
VAAHGEYDELNGPPWLRGEGAKVQHNWLHSFLNNVVMLRPWLRIRMPSFHLTNEQATTIVDYFASLSQREAGHLRGYFNPVQRYMDKKSDEMAEAGSQPAEGRLPGDEWYREPQFKEAARYLAQYTVDNRLKNPLDFHGDPSSDIIAQAYTSALKQVMFIEDLYDVHYPFVSTPENKITEQTFDLGRQLVIEDLDCLACHALGDPDVPGANKNPTAPNLSLAHVRLRRDWVWRWMQEPAWIQPGTKMPQWFPDGRSAFVDWGDIRPEVEAKYGKTGPEQIRLLIDFLYEAGKRGFTGVKGGAAATEPQ